MPRITVAEGPSNPDAAPGEVGYTGPDVDEAPAAKVHGEHGPELVAMSPDAAVVAAADYASMTQAALRDEAKTRGLPVGGSKADLATRLTDHDAAQPSAAVAVGLAAAGQQGANT